MNRKIYPLKHHSEEVLAVVGAKISRSSHPFDEIMATIDEEMASDFHQKWTLGYGHASVAEMAIPMVALENVSIVASKVIESMRRGAYQERSTRYQKFNSGSVYRPKVYQFGKEEETLYEEAVTECFSSYERLMPKMMEWAEKVIPQDAKNRVGAVKGKAFDSLRYLLPSGTLTSLALRMNALDLSRLISKLLSSELPEFVDVGLELREALQSEIPTLIRHSDRNPWFDHVNASISSALEWTKNSKRAPFSDYHLKIGASLVNYDSQAEAKVLAALLYRLSGWSIDMCRDHVSINQSRWVEWFDDLMSKRGEHDPVPEEFESVKYVFDVVMDFGAYRDLQRHRRCTILPQKLTSALGFVVPDDAFEAGCAAEFADSLNKVRDIVVKLESLGSSLSQYACPLGTLHRGLHIYDLAEAYYVIELRSRPAGHISYRKIVNEEYENIQAIHPMLAKWIRCTRLSTTGVHS